MPNWPDFHNLQNHYKFDFHKMEGGIWEIYPQIKIYKKSHSISTKCLQLRDAGIGVVNRSFFDKTSIFNQ